MELRRRQGVLRRRLGMLAQQSQEARWRQQQQQQQAVSPVEEAKRMLNKFGGLVQLAKSEVAMIRDIARSAYSAQRCDFQNPK